MGFLKSRIMLAPSQKRSIKALLSFDAKIGRHTLNLSIALRFQTLSLDVDEPRFNADPSKGVLARRSDPDPLYWDTLPSALGHPLVN